MSEQGQVPSEPAREQQVIESFLAAENATLRAERDEARRLFEELSQTDLGRLNSELHGARSVLERTREELQRAYGRNAEYLHQRDEARRLARWLYEHGGQQILDTSGGGDTSEWPWLTTPARADDA